MNGFFNNAGRTHRLLMSYTVLFFLSCTALAQVPRGCTPSAMGTQFADVTGRA
jgi:hypothetical protein